MTAGQREQIMNGSVSIVLAVICIAIAGLYSPPENAYGGVVVAITFICALVFGVLGVAQLVTVHRGRSP